MSTNDVPYFKELLCSRTLEKAREVCKRLGNRLTVTKLDGEPMVTTADVDPNRVRVEVSNGDVTDVVGLG